MGEIIKLEYGSALYAKSLALRQKILRDPLQLKYSETELKQDERIEYFVYQQGNEVTGVVGLEIIDNERSQLRQMAVAQEMQNRGIGQSLVAYLENYAVKIGLKEIHLDARLDAEKFYAKLGYARYGEIYEKIGIPHVNMKKSL